MDKIIKSSDIKGSITVPASKSDAQRALLAAALAEGQISTIHNPGKSKDVLGILLAINQLGAKTTWIDDTTISIIGTSIKAFGSHLDVGESGLALRLLTSFASLSESAVTLEGEGSLLQRKHYFFDLELPKFGVKVFSNDGRIPITVNGPLLGGEVKIDAGGSSQTISGLMMALPLVAKDSIIQVKNLTSRPYLNMTLQTLERFGIRIEGKTMDSFHISGQQHYTACEYQVEGDWSAASYWLVAAALGQDVEVKGLSMLSLQADKALLTALMSAGCNPIISSNGIKINGLNRKPLTFDASHCPDLFPALVTYASLTEGTSVIKGVGRLANKESDRGKVLQQEFGKLGVNIVIKNDEMHITGERILSSAQVDTHGDHRIAMCLAIAGLFSGSEVTICGAESVDKSYPEFWEDLNQLTKN